MKMKLIFLILSYLLLVAGNLDEDFPNIKDYAESLNDEFMLCLKPLIIKADQRFSEKKRFQKELFIACNPDHLRCAEEVKRKFDDGNFTTPEEDFRIFKLFYFSTIMHLEAPNPFCEYFYDNIDDLERNGKFECYENADVHPKMCTIILSTIPKTPTESTENELLTTEDCRIFKNFVECMVSIYKSSCKDDEVAIIGEQYLEKVLKNVGCLQLGVDMRRILVFQKDEHNTRNLPDT